MPLAPLADEQPVPYVKTPEDKWAKRVGLDHPNLPGVKRITPQSLMKAVLTEDPYPIRVLCIHAHNPLLTLANAKETYQALKKVDFLVVAEMFMTPTAALADIVLPESTYFEFDSVVSPPYSDAAILAQQAITRVGDCKSDYEMLAELAKKMGFGEQFWDTEEECWDLVLKPAGLTFQELEERGPIPGTKHYGDYEENGFATPSEKVEIYSSRLKGWGFDPLPTYYEPPESPQSDPELAKEYPLIFTNAKSRAYRHSGGRQIATLRGIHPEPVVNINPETATKLGIKDGDMVYIENKRGRIKQKAALDSSLDPRVIVADFGWWFPEKGASELYGWEESNINILTSSDPPYNREIGSTNLRGLLCRVYKVT